MHTYICLVSKQLQALLKISLLITVIVTVGSLSLDCIKTFLSCFRQTSNIYPFYFQYHELYTNSVIKKL